MDGKRPSFASIRDFSEFSRYYWYRDELVQICRAHGLACDGGKLRLNAVIAAYFNGERIVPKKRPQRKKKAPVAELTPSMGLIECDFTFGNRFREFFAEQTGRRPFKFTVDMVATVKAVKEKGDEAFTLGDLLDVYYGKKVYARYDKSALQWNRFVQDFFADEATGQFDERLQAAAALWSIVRDSDREKKYTRELLDTYKDVIQG